MTAVQDHSDSHESAPLVSVFLTFQLIGLFGLILLILTAALAKRVKRNPTWYNFVVSWIISCISYSFIFIIGQQEDPQFGPCLFQESLIYGAPVLTSSVTLAFAIDMLLNILAASAPQRSQHRRRYLTILLLVMPYLVWLGIVISLLVYGGENPKMVRKGPNGTYCDLEADTPSKVSSGLTVILTFVLLIIEGYITARIIKNRRVLNKDNKLIRMAVRVMVFSIFGAVGLGIGIAYVLYSIPGASFDVIMSTLPTGLILIFGTQADLLSVWTFWRAPPMEGAANDKASMVSLQASIGKVYQERIPLPLVHATRLLQLRTPDAGTLTCIPFHSTGEFLRGHWQDWQFHVHTCSRSKVGAPPSPCNRPNTRARQKEREREAEQAQTQTESATPTASDTNTNTNTATTVGGKRHRDRSESFATATASAGGADPDSEPPRKRTRRKSPPPRSRSRSGSGSENSPPHSLEDTPTPKAPTPPAGIPSSQFTFTFRDPRTATSLPGPGQGRRANQVLTSVSGLAEPLSSSPSGLFPAFLGYTNDPEGRKRVYADLVDAFRLCVMRSCANERSHPELSFAEWMARVEAARVLPAWWDASSRAALTRYASEDRWGRLDRVVSRADIQKRLPSGHQGRIRVLDEFARTIAGATEIKTVQ
uniref:G-protein coupled receptors family 1 profile domain-containing protein n=1 Tax=Mycena chlorophos TaxID=658473 RepID=A0ABQ0M1Y5_MYCCL|nr:predicted protein [Mycena chlorophos]